LRDNRLGRDIQSWRPVPAAPFGESCRPTLEFRLCRHAEWEMSRRGISLALVPVVMDHPEKRLVDEFRVPLDFVSRGDRSQVGECICC